MIRRGEASHRHYTELCNRSGSSQLRPAHAQTNNADSHEDYWEDASVSLRSYHSWEAPSIEWLSNSSTHRTIDEENEESKSLCDVGSHIRPCRYSFDASDFLGSVKGRRRFPPPLASCSTLSIKEGGRFVLKEMDADRPQGFFRAQRENGRLLLQLVLPVDEMNDEDATVGDDDEEDDGGEDEDSSFVVECREEAGSGLCEEFGHVEYDPHGEEFTRANHSGHTSCKEEVDLGNVHDGSAEKAILNDCVCACQTSSSECEVDDSGRPLGNGLQAAGSKVIGCSASQDVSNEGGSWMQIGSTLLADGHFLEGSHSDTLVIRKGGDLVDKSRISSSEGSHFVSKGSFGEGEGEGEGDVLAPHQQLLWDVDVANHARASISPWLSNPLCLHQPLVTIQPAIRLAMF